MRIETAAEAANPKAKVDRIMSELLGQDFDLLSRTGRDAAIEAIGERQSDDGPAPEADTVEVPEKNSLSAWKAARSLCATLQINAALARLDKLEPLPDEGEVLTPGTDPDDFATARRQVREQLQALRDEYSQDNDAEVLENIYRSLFGGDKPLFDQLRESGNFVPKRVNDRKDEVHVIHYVAVRGLVAMLCSFNLGCKTPTKEPTGQSSVSESLTLTERAVVCARDTGRHLHEELGAMGITSDCAMDAVPGLDFEARAVEEAEPEVPKVGKSKAYAEKDRPVPTVRELLVLIDRVEGASDAWIAALDKDGRRGAHLIRSEIDRLAAKAQRFKPKPPTKGKDWPPVARLTDHFVEELDRAAHGIGRLLES
ncbi:hypothetical protein [Sulfitobacter sp. JB4-11]|uniref:hypothetical protein n=1 Tax=Sulfitobacter rhodophyticola TaxID=3238304 RepID=UPI00351410D8